MKTKIYILLLSLLSLNSCNNWLEVTPQGQIEASDLLTNEKGYNSALGGIYYMLSSSGMYGQNLTYGMMDILAQYWDISNNLNHQYYKLSQYDYKDATSVGSFNSIWKQYYSIIAQCNQILSSLEKNKPSIQNAELIEGEALALRAFAHMELFRLFGPVIHNDADLDKIAIAYRTEFNVTAQKFESGRSILTKVKNDFLKALGLLQNDPIIANGRRGDGNSSLLDYQDILNYRGARMNYYAILGMLARLEQLMLNQDQAYTYAKQIIDENTTTGVIKLIDKSNIETGNDAFKDLNYSCEMLFSLYTNNLYDLTNATFYMDGGTFSSNSSLIINSNLYTTFLNQLYGRQPDGSGSDNRLKYWFEANDKSNYDLTKLRKARAGINMAPPYYPEVPILRLSEIYYIASEAQIGKNNDLALSYLNDVRETRNLTRLNGPLSNEELAEYLIREQRKDFIGEGRMFPLYKRLFTSIYVKEGLSIAPTDDKFVFPIPDAEFEYSPNEKSKQ